jgi:glycosyltransferase involved in cell wall biosynthesis
MALSPTASGFDPMLRILQITDKGPGAGGVRAVVEDHARMLEEQGLEVRRLRLHHGVAGEADQTEIRAPVGFAQDARTQHEALETLRRAAGTADLIHLHLGTTAVTPEFVTAAAATAPLLVTLHDISPFPDLSGYVEPLSLRERLGRMRHKALRQRVWQRVCACAEAIHAPSAYLSGLAIRAGAPAARVVVLPHAIRVPGIACQPVTGTAPLLIHAGLLSAPKGAGHLLPAFLLVSDRSARLTICGDGPMAGTLKREILQLGLSDRVTMTGRIPHDQVLGLFGRARAVLQPSLIPEGFGLTVLEAMSLGRPVIGFASGATAEWIMDGVTGLVAPPAPAGALAAALDRVLASPELAGRLGDEGRRRAQAVCLPERIGQELASLCRRVALSRQARV